MGITYCIGWRQCHQMLISGRISLNLKLVCRQSIAMAVTSVLWLYIPDFNCVFQEHPHFVFFHTVFGDTFYPVSLCFGSWMDRYHGLVGVAIDMRPGPNVARVCTTRSSDCGSLRIAIFPDQGLVRAGKLCLCSPSESQQKQYCNYSFHITEFFIHVCMFLLIA